MSAFVKLSRWIAGIAVIAWLVPSPALLRLHAGGRACACEQLLQNLDAARVPLELRPDAPYDEVIAAFDLGERPVSALVFVEEGGSLVVAEAGPARRGEGEPGRVMVYDLTGQSAERTGQIDATNDFVEGLAVNPQSGQVVAMGSVRWDQKLAVWGVNDNAWRKVHIEGDFSDWWLGTLAFSPDGSLLATTSGDSSGPVRLWTVSDSGLERGHVLPGPDSGLSAASFSPDGRFVAAGLGSGHHHPDDGQLLIWDLSGSEPTLAHQSTPIASGFDLSAITWLSDGESLVLADQQGKLQFARFADGALQPGELVNAHDRGIRSLVPIRGGSVVSSGFDGRIKRWSAAGDLMEQFNLGGGRITLAVAPSGRHLAAGMADGVVYVLKLDDIDVNGVRTE